MAKQSIIQRELKKEKLVAKYAEKRAKLKAIVKDLNASDEERWEAQQALQQLPRSSSHTRLRNRCELTGRPRGYHKRVRLSRIALRDLASKGQIPGMNKSSW